MPSPKAKPAAKTPRKAPPAKPTEKTGQKAPIDWERIEADYRAGVLSLREIAAPHDVSHVTVKKRAEREGWVRDLKAKIQAKAEELVNTAEVNKGVNSKTAVSERQIIDRNATSVAEIKLGHRGDIGRSRRLVVDLLAELETQTAGIEVFERLGELMDKSGEDDNGRPIVDKLNEAYQKVISLSGRVANIKALSDALKNLVALERQAWGLDTATPKEGAGDITITF